MRDLKSHRLIYLKGVLFLTLGLIASGMLLLEAPHLRAALLLAIAVWAFCRFYYFAFYVMEKYVEPGRRYAGLWSFFRETLRRRRGDE